MSERNFSRRRRGGMRFRPSGGMHQQQQQQHPKRQERAAQEARAEATGEKPVKEGIFDRSRYHKEIERAENIAAGLPPDGPPKTESQAPQRAHPAKREFREPHLDTPAQVKEEGYQPVHVREQPPQGLVETIKAAANKVIKKVHRIIKPVAPNRHKELIINSESLEARVAVLEEGKLEEFTIERATDERLVGSIYKGKVRNLEDGLKAAFVDMGFEKNAFLHYCDIVPSSFDSSAEPVERDTRKL